MVSSSCSVKFDLVAYHQTLKLIVTSGETHQDHLASLQSFVETLQAEEMKLSGQLSEVQKAFKKASLDMAAPVYKLPPEILAAILGQVLANEPPTS